MNKKEDQITQTIPNEISIVDRKTISMSGVKEVVSASPTQIIIKTELGPLEIKGHDLKIVSVNEETLSTQVLGEFQELRYTNKKPLLKRLFK